MDRLARSTAYLGDNMLPPKHLGITVDPASIIRNITKFFGEALAFTKESLQNSRRAEASAVTVVVDPKAKTVTVADNGHGVMDPKALVTIGQSDWAQKVGAEMPAGMGLFSAFVLGNQLSVCSGTWRIDVDFTLAHTDKAVRVTYDLPRITGTAVTVRLDDEMLAAATAANVTYNGYFYQAGKTANPTRDVAPYANLAAAFITAALYMPFDSTVTLQGCQPVKVPAFSMSVYDLWSATKWSTTLVTDDGRKIPVDICQPGYTGKNGNSQYTSRSDNFLSLAHVSSAGPALAEDGTISTLRAYATGGTGAQLITQGICVQLSDYNLPDCVVKSPPDAVDLRLPDREAVVATPRTQAFVKALQAAVHKKLFELVCAREASCSSTTVSAEPTDNERAATRDLFVDFADIDACVLADGGESLRPKLPHACQFIMCGDRVLRLSREFTGDASTYIVLNRHTAKHRDWADLRQINGLLAHDFGRIAYLQSADEEPFMQQIVPKNRQLLGLVINLRRYVAGNQASSCLFELVSLDIVTVAGTHTIPATRAAANVLLQTEAPTPAFAAYRVENDPETTDRDEFIDDMGSADSFLLYTDSPPTPENIDAGENDVTYDDNSDSDLLYIPGTTVYAELTKIHGESANNRWWSNIGEIVSSLTGRAQFDVTVQASAGVHGANIKHIDVVTPDRRFEIEPVDGRLRVTRRFKRKKNT